MNEASKIIALNGRFTGKSKPTGTQIASSELFASLVKNSCGKKFILFADTRAKNVRQWSEFDSVIETIHVPFLDWGALRAHYWEQFEFPRMAGRKGCSIMLNPMNTAPVFTLGLQNVVTLHDLNFFLHPEWYSFSFRALYKFVSVTSIKQAQHVVVISNYVAEHAKIHLGLDSRRLSIAPNGLPSLPAPSGAMPPATQYLLSVGAFQPHKNLPRLIKAYRQLKTSFPGLELWLVGRPQENFNRNEEVASLLQTPGIKLLGYLDSKDLADVYSGAAAFCFPSLEEGFGLPVLEAMYYGVPVVTSNTSCLPEICGGNAVLVDPMNVNEIESGIAKILRLDATQKEQQVRKARQWAESFSWDAASQEYFKVFEHISIQLDTENKIKVVKK